MRVNGEGRRQREGSLGRCMIHLLFTGGTISMQRDAAAGGNVPAHGGRGAREPRAGARRGSHRYRIENWAKLPACHLGPDRLWALRERVRRDRARRARCAGIVITHGTDTIEETAYLLARTLTAAMSGRDHRRDADLERRRVGWPAQPARRRARWRRARRARDEATMVVFNGADFRRARRRSRRTPPMSTPSPRRTRRRSGGLRAARAYSLRRRARPAPPRAGRGLERARRAGRAGRGRRWHAARPRATRHDGVVVVAFGSGNMPPGAVPAMRRWLDEGKPVVLASRCPYGAGHAGLRVRGRRRAHRGDGRDSGRSPHAVAGADGAGPRALGRRALRRGDERSRRPGDPGGGARDRPHARGGGPRGLVRRRRAPRRAAGPPALRLRLRHVGHAGPGAQRCSDARRRSARSTARWACSTAAACCTRSPPSAATSPPTAAMRWSAYGVSLDDDLARRDFTINAIAYHPLRARVARPVRRARRPRARRAPRRGRSGASASARTTSASSAALRFAARFGFAIEPATWAAAVAAAPRARRSSPRSGCGTSGSRALRTARVVAGAGGALARERRGGAAGCPSSTAVPAGALWRAARGRPRERRDPVLLTVLLLPMTRPTCSAASGRPTPRSSARPPSRAGRRRPPGGRRRGRAALARHRGPGGRRSARALRALRHGRQRRRGRSTVRRDSRARRSARPRRPGGRRQPTSRHSAPRARGSARLLAALLDRVLDDPSSTRARRCWRWPGSCCESARLRGRRGARQRRRRARRRAPRAPEPAGDRRRASRSAPASCSRWRCWA